MPMTNRVRASYFGIVFAGFLLAGCGIAKTGATSSSVSRSSLPVTITTPTAPVTITTPTIPVSHQVVPPTTATTSKPKPNLWPMRTIASTGQAQDVAPTSSYVYWLSQPGIFSNDGAPVTVYQYNPISGKVRRGPSFTGFVGSAALTDTGGWVWMVIGVSDDVDVEQLDPSTLGVRSTESLPVKDNLEGEPQVNPVLTATVDGPLWVAGGEDLWALNPSTGSVETEFDTGNWIGSMSTDPSGSLLYTGGLASTGGMIVKQYNAQTGAELQNAFKPEYLAAAISVETVAATTGGVWISVRYGMAGPAFELSSHNLEMIAPPPQRGFGTYDQFMGVASSVSEGTLWLSNEGGQTSTLVCADPTTGAVRARDVTPTFAVGYATGERFYAVTASGQVVVIAPPAKCFG